MTYLTTFLISLFSLAKYALAVLAFAPFFERRKLFAVRAASSLLVLVMVAAVTALFSGDDPVVAVSGDPSYLIYLIYTLCLLAGVLVCYRGRVSSFVFHLFSAAVLFSVVSFLRQIVLSIGRGEDGVGVVVPDEIWDILIQAGLMLVLYGGAYFVFGRKGPLYRDIRIGTAPFVLCLATGVILALLSVVATTYKYTDVLSSNLLLLAAVLYCLICLFVQYSVFIASKAEAQKEKEHLARESAEQISKESLRQYNTLKQNIDIINVKCHDMKHVLRNYRENGDADRERYLDELDRTIEIYDCTVKTGNDVLDVILTELHLRCNAGGIRMSCMADGECLSFLEEPDIFSLFGNIVDNAVEYLMSVDPENRSFRLNVYRQNDFSVIRAENYYEGTLKLNRDGLPVTTKEDGDYHGYGIRSIRMIAKKYGGTAAVSAGDGVFSVAVLIPRPKETNGK